MRRLARGCTTEPHLLYGVAMGRLSQAIFEWDSADYGFDVYLMCIHIH